MRRFRPERGALLGVAVLLLLSFLGGRGAAEPAPPPAAAPAANPNAPPPGTILLLLPAVTGRGGDWIAPWTNPSDTARFAGVEKDLASRFQALGYGTMTAREALAAPDASAALRDAPRPISPEAAASAARTARATLALVIRADALRRSESGQTFTDALVSAEVYRAADAVKLAWGSTKVSGSGATEAEADAAALAHAAPRIVEALSGPLLSAVQRPVIAPHPFTITLEGNLGYRDYRRLLGLLQHQVPEIRELREQRFTHGRQRLLAICACQPWDIAQRLDGRTTGGFSLEVRSGMDGVQVRARPTGAGSFAP